jgi:hypothetical protein
VSARRAERTLETYVDLMMLVVMALFATLLVGGLIAAAVFGVYSFAEALT